MSNSSFADISVFESLQNQAHESMGVSPMSVFNAPASVQEIKHVCDDLVQAIDDCIPAWTKYRQAQIRYNQTVKTVMEHRKQEAESAATAKKQGNPEPQKAFEREEKVIQEAWRKVVNKQAEIQRLR